MNHQQRCSVVFPVGYRARSMALSAKRFPDLQAASSRRSRIARQYRPRRFVPLWHLSHGLPVSRLQETSDPPAFAPHQMNRQFFSLAKELHPPPENRKSAKLQGCAKLFSLVVLRTL